MLSQRSLENQNLWLSKKERNWRESYANQTINGYSYYLSHFIHCYIKLFVYNKTKFIDFFMSTIIYNTIIPK